MRSKLSRREVLAGGAGLLAGGALTETVRRVLSARGEKSLSLTVNDLHSQLNSTTVKSIERPHSLEDLIGLLRRTGRSNESVCIAASRHAMGGQQFASGAVMIDTRSMNGVIDFDKAAGTIEVEAGIEWPDLLAYLLKSQRGVADAWTIPTKQTGADKLSLGGALSANAHGRTLTQGPFITHLESLLLVTADGTPLRCSRTQNPELFSLVVGGYGLFGVVHSVVLRLIKRQKIERTVAMVTSDQLIESFDQRIKEGYTLGDFQYVTDEKSPDFLRRGVFSCYRPVDPSTPVPEGQDSISDREWSELVYLAHADKAKAFQLYADYYMKTTGQVYWADTFQLGGYDLDYHQGIDSRMKTKVRGSEMITEINVPRERLADFLKAAAGMLRAEGVSTIYGTIRLIEPDHESFLTWAKGRFACVIFNLHVDHSKEGIEKAASAFRKLIDLGLDRGGSYYLTYHRWATKQQVLRAYPQFPQFLKKKLEYDPKERFQSEWYRHYRAMFA